MHHKQRASVVSASAGRGHSRHYTLVELLVICAIVGVLLAVASPAFKTMTLGSGVDHAARMLSSQFRLARQYAISQRQRVAVLLPTQAMSIYQATDYSAFRACVVTGTTGNYVFSNWVPKTQWEPIPQGAVIAAVRDTAPPNPPEDGTTPTYQEVKTVPKAPTTDGTKDVRAVIFKPDGKLDTTGTAVFVSVAEGITVPSLLLRQNNGKYNYRTMRLNKHNGRLVFLE